ncbi:MAG: hypothetical protein ACP5LQ_03715 [Candidatus Methanodesulfokora sp.]
MSRQLLPSLLLFLFLFSLLTVNAQMGPLVYKNYNVKIIILNDGSAILSYEMEMENAGTVPVVPGYGLINVSSGKVVSASAFIMGRKGEAVIEGNAVRYSVWEVINPGKSIRVEVNVTVSGFLSRGVLFDEFQAEIGPISYPVIRGDVKVIPPTGKNIVYLSKKNLNAMRPGDVAQIRGELSLIPLPLLPFSWYPIFWTAVIAVIVLIWLVRRVRH